MKTHIVLNWRHTKQRLVSSGSGYMVSIKEGANVFDVTEIVMKTAAEVQSQEYPSTIKILEAIEKALVGKATIERVETLLIDLV